MLLEKSLSSSSDAKLKIWASIGAVFFLIIFSQLPFMVFHKILDTGYHLTNQQTANQLGIQYIRLFPFWWLSDIVGGWWLKGTDFLGMWGARLGGVVALALTGAFSLATLLQIYRPNLALIGAMVFTAFCLPNDTINYVSLPTLFYSIFSFFFLKLHIQPKKNLYPILSGLTLVLLIFSRMPLIVEFALPLFCLLFCSLKREQYVIYLKAYLKMYGTALSLFIAFGLYLTFQNLLKSYLFYESPTPTHTSSVLLSLLVSQYLRKIPFILGSAILGAALFVMIKYKILSKKASTTFAIGTLIASAIFAAFYLRFPAIKAPLLFIWPDAFDVYPILISLSICSFLLLKTQVSFQEIVLFILGSTWPVLLTLGSAAAINIWLMIGFLLVGQLTCFFTRVARHYDCKSHLFCIGALLFLIIGGKGFKELTYPFHSPQMTSPFHTQKLSGIYTTTERANHFDALIAEIKKRTKKGDSIIAEPYLSMVYYASDTLPLGNHPCLLYLPKDQYLRKIEQILSHSPRVVVRPKFDGADANTIANMFLWPKNKDFVNDTIHKYEILNTAMHSLPLKLVWSNEYYELYIPK